MTPKSPLRLDQIQVEYDTDPAPAFMWDADRIVVSDRSLALSGDMVGRSRKSAKGLRCLVQVSTSKSRQSEAPATNRSSPPNT